jgi:lysophospholipase L1-like esterase
MKPNSSRIPVILIGILAVALAVGLFMMRDGLNERYLSEGELNLPPAPASNSGVPSADVHREKVVIIGDSFTGGSGEGGTGDKGWPALTGRRLTDEGFAVDVRMSGEGGSGYVAQGPSRTTFGAAAARLVEPDDTAVIYFGSINDSESAQNREDDLQAAVSQTIQATRKTAPNARIVIVGPPLNPLEPADQQQVKFAVRDILKEQARLAGLAFVDPIQDGWFADRPDLFGGVHPNGEGHVYLADKFTPLIADLLEHSNT